MKYLQKNEIQVSFDTSKDKQNHLSSALFEFDNLLKQNLDKDFSDFVDIVIAFLSSSSQACTGIYYSHQPQESTYQLESIFGSGNQNSTQIYSAQEGLVGQVIQSGKAITYLDLPPKSYLITISNFELSIKSICIFPVVFNHKIYGAIYFDFLNTPTNTTLLFLEQAVQNLGVMIENIHRYGHVNSLLKQSEEQKEELSQAKELVAIQAKKTDEAFSLLQINYGQLMKSIQYAQKIQNAFLPQTSSLKADFSDFFVLYLPKDTVSGDFYWYHKFLDTQIIAVGDCTGHGVPGAFMSLFAINILNKIISEQKVLAPHSILENLRQEVKTFLQRDGKGLQDGLDISICNLTKKSEQTYTMTYSGAKSSIFYTKDQELKILKSDRNAIGGIHCSEDVFTSKEIELKSNEIIYFYTDGITDICNDKRKSYGTKALTEFLQKNKQLPMEKQKLNLQQEITDYQGVQDQRDDITVLGIQLN